MLYTDSENSHHRGHYICTQERLLLKPSWLLTFFLSYRLHDMTCLLNIRGLFNQIFACLPLHSECDNTVQRYSWHYCMIHRSGIENPTSKYHQQFVHEKLHAIIIYSISRQGKHPYLETWKATASQCRHHCARQTNGSTLKKGKWCS